jgi:hypothetical protein
VGPEGAHSIADGNSYDDSEAADSREGAKRQNDIETAWPRWG